MLCANCTHRLAPFASHILTCADESFLHTFSVLLNCIGADSGIGIYHMLRVLFMPIPMLLYNSATMDDLCRTLHHDGG